MQQSKRKRLQMGKTIGITGGRFYFLTILYGFWFLCGGCIGFARKGSYLCLGVSISIGIIVILLGFGHLIEYNRGVKIEPFFILIPFFISAALGVVMSTFYGISAGSSSFVPFGMVGAVCSIVAAIYAALFWRDFLRNKNLVSHNTFNYGAPRGSSSSQRSDDSLRPRHGLAFDPYLPGSRDPLL